MGILLCYIQSRRSTGSFWTFWWRGPTQPLGTVRAGALRQASWAFTLAFVLSCTSMVLTMICSDIYQLDFAIVTLVLACIPSVYVLDIMFGSDKSGASRALLSITASDGLKPSSSSVPLAVAVDTHSSGPAAASTDHAPTYMVG